jgi:hypothetical protein
MKTASFAAIATIIAAAPVAAMETEQVYGPNDLRFATALESKHYDRGLVLVNDVTNHTTLSGRYYGAGLRLDGWMAASQDKTTRDDTIKPGEITGFKARIDYLVQIDYLNRKDLPPAQIIPHFEYVTYPDQKASVFKDHQRWIGIEGWINPPFVGFQGIWFGGSLDWNLSEQWLAFNSSFGAREIIQYSPFDFQLFQLVSAANAAHNRQFGGADRSSLTVLEIGGKITYPLISQDWWTFVKLSAFSWLDDKQREINRNADISNGGLIMAVGVEWVYDRKRQN